MKSAFTFRVFFFSFSQWGHAAGGFPIVRKRGKQVIKRDRSRALVELRKRLCYERPKIIHHHYHHYLIFLCSEAL